MSLQLEHVRKDYVAPDRSTLTVLDIEQFTLGDGEQIALVGTSGSGKTTLLHVIAGIVAPDRGTIQFGNVDLVGLTEPQRDIFRGQNIGYIFQTHHLLGGLTSMENVLLGMSFAGRASDPAWAKHLLDAVGLSDRLHYKPGKLSVGQQQRVAVARALANRPKLVLADEPTGALDERNAQQVLQLIRNLCTEVNAALLLVTHDMGIANQFPRVVSLKDLNRASA